MLILDRSPPAGLGIGEGAAGAHRAGNPRRGVTFRGVKKRLDDPATRQALKNQMVREKTLDFLLKNATITP
jgi:hypothetical protein